MYVLEYCYHYYYRYCPDLVEVESPEKLYLSNPNRETTSSESTPSFPCLSPDQPEVPLEDAQDKDVKKDLSLFETQWTVTDTDPTPEDLRRESIDKPADLSLSVEVSHLDGEVHRKRSRISMGSIASNLSNRFRKSADLEAEDVLRLMRERSSSERDSSERDSTEPSTYDIIVTIIRW